MPRNTSLDINHPTDYPIRLFILQTRLAAIDKSTVAHRLVYESLQELQAVARSSISDVFLGAVLVEFGRIGRVLADLAAELVKVSAEIKELKKAERKRLGQK